MKINTLHCCNGAEIRLSYDSPVIQPTLGKKKTSPASITALSLHASFSGSLFPYLAAPIPFLFLPFLFSSLSIVIYHSLSYMSTQVWPCYIFFHRQLFTFFNCMLFVFLSSLCLSPSFSHSPPSLLLWKEFAVCRQCNLDQ